MEYSKCWLQYKKLSDSNQSDIMIYCNSDGNIIRNAMKELDLAFHSLYGRKVIAADDENIVRMSVTGIFLKLDSSDSFAKEEGYFMECVEGKCTISSGSEAGLLYGVFALLRNLQLRQVINFDAWSFKEEKTPSNPLRMLNHWDNSDGVIERGYSGKSFFFGNDEVLVNERIYAYARLVSSVSINAVVINNVNVKGAATELISDRYYTKLRSISEILGSYGVKLFISINFAAPVELGGLDSADPCESSVRAWWAEKSEEIWRNVPEIGGFLVKADSEGRPGPFTYKRTHAEGANMLAEAVRPFGGLIIWRCFVYNCQQDWRDTKTDRARAGFDNFMPLDGMFSDNVILQIKNGPMDFQVREPVSPLFGGLRKTNMMLEVQLAQEYTGQQRHVCYLIPWFKEILSFHTYCDTEKDKVSDVISGRTYRNMNCGIAAVSNTGDDFNWTGHDLAAANLYGFGRLAADTELLAEDIAGEWIYQTFGQDEKIQDNIQKILLMSWRTYEKYTSPLGIGWMVKPNIHYGPDVDGYEYDRWGTYHKADHEGIGVDRSYSGTGFCSQYNEPLASMYANRISCPEELLLFFHHTRYDYVLSSGKTVLQHIYDTHFEGAAETETFLEMWKELQDRIEPDTYQRTQIRLEHQRDHAKEWRDVINSYFFRKTGIGDRYNRTIY